MQTVNIIVKYNLKPDQDSENLVEGELVGNAISLSKPLELPESFEEAVEILGESKVFATFLRQYKVDFGNNEREKLKASNGHSVRVALSEEQKAENKAKRADDKKILEALLAKGISLEDIASL